MRRVRGLPKLKKLDKNDTYKGILEIIHTDLCGTIDVQSYKGDKYIMLFVDDYSRMMTIIFLKHKSDAF